MKALIITIDKYPHRGGKSTHIFNLVSGLKEYNVECDVFSGNYIPQIQYKLLKSIIYFTKFISKKYYLFYRKRIELFLFKKQLKKFVKNKEYNFISFQDAITCGSCGYLFKKNFLTMHTYFGIEYTLDNSGFSLDDKYYKKLLSLEENSLKYVDSVICVDERIKTHVIETVNKYNMALPIYSVCNFTNTNIFKPVNKSINNKSKIVIGCVRRLVEKNGVIYSAMAMKYLKNYNCVLKIYGDGPCMQDIIQYVEKEKLSKNVILCGGVDNDKMAGVYKDIDIIIVPSITVNGLQEATSISAIESMACGIPTIASNIGGLPLLIKNNENGILVTEKNPKEIANAIIKLINDKKLYNKISKGSREYILDNNSHLKAAKEYLNIFKI